MSKQKGFNLIYFVYNKYRNNVEYLYMSEAPETVIQEDTNKNIIEEATQKAAPEINESTTQESIKNEVKQEDNANEEQFKNKTDRMKHKQVNCKDYGVNLTLKTLRKL